MREIVIAAIVTALTATAASAGSPTLAAPGDCAQPIRDLDPGPVGMQAPASDSAAGSPIDDFAPIPVVGGAVANTTNVIDAIVSWIAPSTDAATADTNSQSLLSTSSLPVVGSPQVVQLNPPAVAPSLDIAPSQAVPPPATPMLNAVPNPTAPTMPSSPVPTTSLPILGGSK